MDIDLIRGAHEHSTTTISSRPRTRFPHPVQEEYYFPNDDGDQSVDIARDNNGQNEEENRDEEEEKLSPKRASVVRQTKGQDTSKSAGTPLKESAKNEGIDSSHPVESSEPTTKRRLKRRWFSSTDSLAGCSVASANSIKFIRKEVDQDPAGQSTAEMCTPSNTVAQSRTPRALATNGKCGKCPGCRQTFDCLTCARCIASLQEGVRFSQGGTRCVKRICKAAAYHQKQPMDTLVGQELTKPAGWVSSSGATTLSQQQEEMDDTSVSYFSETGSLFSTASKKRKSRVARMWSRRWSKERQQMFENNKSALSPLEQASACPPRPSADTSTSKKRRKGGKKAKSALHDLELPMPRTDSSSVASMMEGRRALRALMQYDEADQDWL